MVKVCIGYVRLDMSFGGRMFLEIPSWVGLLILPIGFSSILFRFVLRGIEQASVLLGGLNQ
jgi:TRAP-type C4-dicarboxylate transport system permease small subunit